ncbi:MAG: DUF4166 domain-containing protein [Emcibacteraceae bacterium]
MNINIALHQRSRYHPLNWFKPNYRAVNDNGKVCGHHGDFRPLVAGGGWYSLSEGIKSRFDAMAENPALVRFIGTMEVKRSKIGVVFAWLCKIFGSPLTHHCGNDVPVTVDVFPVPSGGMCWQRIYNFNRHNKVTVQSIKLVDKEYGLLECVGGGLGMRLNVFEKGGALHFKSNKYFFEMLGFRISIPLIITPGAIHVVQSDVDAGFFRFYLSFNHPWFGQTFYQNGVFTKEEKSNE